MSLVPATSRVAGQVPQAAAEPRSHRHKHHHHSAKAPQGKFVPPNRAHTGGTSEYASMVQPAHGPQPAQAVNLSGLRGLSVAGTAGLDTGRFTVSSQMPVCYTVEEVHGLFDMDNKNLLRGMVPDSFPSRLGLSPIEGPGQRRFVVIDDTVDAIYGQQLENYFKYHQVEYELVKLPTREENKSFELVFEIAERLEAFKLNRRKEPIIAIGGGVCLDVAGLAANLYRRNTPVIKVPTTVMAAVDASIGIKTAVNFHDKKNKLGTYSPPLAVFIDTAFLQTLDRRHLCNGAAEILKMACIKDDELFHVLEAHGPEIIATNFQSAAGQLAIRRSIQGMLEELEGNLWEHCLSRLVDYGHTFSPEIEMAALNTRDMLLHGEAVNIDMAITTQLAYHRGMINLTDRNRVFNVMEGLGLALWHESCSNLPMLLRALDDATRARDGFQHMPCMVGIGKAIFLENVTHAEVASAAEAVATYHAAQIQIPLAALNLTRPILQPVPA